MNLKRHWPFLAALALGVYLWRRPQPRLQNPGGQATAAELAYTQYLTDHVPHGINWSPPLGFDEWIRAGRPKS